MNTMYNQKCKQINESGQQSKTKLQRNFRDSVTFLKVINYQGWK